MKMSDINPASEVTITVLLVITLSGWWAENFFPHEEAYDDSDVNQIYISMVNIFCALNVPRYSLTSAA